MFLTADLLGCGYFNAGKWQDDPKNWERAFGQKPPQEIEVVHSYYWRSAHWSYEYQYFFALHGTQKARNILLENDRFKKIDQAVGKDVQDDHYTENAPSWFLPNKIDEYDIWILNDSSHPDFRMYIHKITGDVFMTDVQL